MQEKKKVTLCACASRSFIDKDKVADIASVMKKEGYSVTVVPDLCRKVMQRSPDMQEMTSDVILACYPRAMQSHFDWLGLKAGTVIDIRNAGTEEVLSQFDLSGIGVDSDIRDAIREEIDSFQVESGTDAWYPVLDKERCIECGKCHDFCLFGVYTVENKKVRVEKPQNCKNNCPACARMCPSKAIIFPKYEKSPINGGVAEEEHFNPAEMDAMYRERLRMRLQQRRASVSLLKQDKG